MSPIIRFRQREPTVLQAVIFWIHSALASNGDFEERLARSAFIPPEPPVGPQEDLLSVSQGDVWAPPPSLFPPSMQPNRRRNGENFNCEASLVNSAVNDFQEWKAKNTPTKTPAGGADRSGKGGEVRKERVAMNAPYTRPRGPAGSHEPLPPVAEEDGDKTPRASNATRLTASVVNTAPVRNLRNAMLPVPTHLPKFVIPAPVSPTAKYGLKRGRGIGLARAASVISVASGEFI